MQQQTETTFEEKKNKIHCWWHFVPWILSWTRMGQQHNKESQQGNQKCIVSVYEDCKS